MQSAEHSVFHTSQYYSNTSLTLGNDANIFPPLVIDMRMQAELPLRQLMYGKYSQLSFCPLSLKQMLNLCMYMQASMLGTWRSEGNLI